MIIGRFRIQCRPEWTDRVAAAIAAVEAPSREIPGVVHFDIVRSVSDPDSFLAFEVFEHREAFDAQNAQPEVAALLGLVEEAALTGEYEWTTWEVPAP